MYHKHKEPNCMWMYLVSALMILCYFFGDSRSLLFGLWLGIIASTIYLRDCLRHDCEAITVPHFDGAGGGGGFGGGPVGGGAGSVVKIREVKIVEEYKSESGDPHKVTSYEP